MTVRSVIKIDVDDGEFKAFQSLYEKYDAALKKAPAAWAKVSQETKKTKADMKDAAASMSEQADAANKIVSAHKSLSTYLATAERAWRRIAVDAKGVAGAVQTTTLSLLKWTGIGSAFSAILGGGGLLGLDRIAGSVAGQRSSAYGLGVGIGQQRAFGLNFGRYVDPDSTLHSVSTGLYDKTSPQYLALLQAGISPAFLASHNAADVSAELLRRVPGVAGLQNEGLRGTYLANQPLGSILSLESVNKIFRAGSGELGRQEAAYGRDSGALNINDANATAFQDFETKLSRAGGTLETVFENGLVKLAKPIGDVTTGFEKAAEAFLKSDTVKDSLNLIADGLTKFSNYVGTPEFEKNVKAFVGAVDDLASGAASFVNFLRHPLAPVTDALKQDLSEESVSFDWHKSIIGKAVDWWDSKRPAWLGGASGSVGGIAGKTNNFTNIRYGAWAAAHGATGQYKGFAMFPDPTTGIGAANANLNSYSAKGIDTINGIVNRWSPPTENDTPALVKAMSGRTGYGENQHLDMSDPSVRAKLLRALILQETGKSPYSEDQIRRSLSGLPAKGSSPGLGLDKFQGIAQRDGVTIYNNTGGNAVVTAGSAAGGQ